MKADERDEDRQAREDEAVEEPDDDPGRDAAVYLVADAVRPPARQQRAPDPVQQYGGDDHADDGQAGSFQALQPFVVHRVILSRWDGG